MRRRGFFDFRKFFLTFWLVGGLLVFGAAPRCAMGEAPAAAVAAFDSYASGVEARLARQHGMRDGFLGGGVMAPRSAARLRGGELIVEELTPAGGAALPGALLHHWRGTAFVPGSTGLGATAADFERLMRDFDAYPRYFSPQVVQAKVLEQKGDQMQTVMRVRQRHVITVVMDAAYDVTFGRLDEQHGYSVSRSTRISEIGSPGTGEEHVLRADEEHGFLWRMNTYWSYEERDGGLYIQVESVSLSRSIPRGLGWVVQPFVESVPRESVEFTLRSACKGLLSRSGNRDHKL